MLVEVGNALVGIEIERDVEISRSVHLCHCFAGRAATRKPLHKLGRLRDCIAVPKPLS
jgi:hypothetical protein